MFFLEEPYTLEMNIHHQVALTAQCFKILSCQPSLSSIAPGRSSRLHSVSTQSWSCMPLQIGQYWLIHVYESIEHCFWVTFLLLQQCPLDSLLFCEVLLPVFVQNSILVYLPSSLFSMHFVNIKVVYPYNSTDLATAWKKFYFIREIRFPYDQ